MILSKRSMVLLIFVVFQVGCSSGNTITYPTIAIRPSEFPNLTQTPSTQERYSAQPAEQTLVAQYPRVCENLFSPRDFSPDRVWMVESCYLESERSLILTLSSRENQNLWKLDFRDYISPTDFIPDGGLAVIHWSKDERYVYFNSYVNTSGGECYRRGNVAEGGLGLFRLNLNTGDVTTILSPKDNFGWYVYSFSSKSEKLVYGAFARDFAIIDMSSGKLTNIAHAIDFNEGGGFVWSSDETELVYSTVLYNEISEPINYSLRLVDAKSGSEKVLLESPKDCFNTVSWTGDNILKVEKDFGKTIIEFDLNTNTIIGDTPTKP